jgi:hypothetical protein
MEQVRHNTLGIGEVVSKDVISGFTFLNVRFGNGKEMKLGIPSSFETGAVEALGSLKDEVDQAIAERQARLAAPTPAAAPSAPAKRATAKTMPTGPIATAYEEYLISAGYKEETDEGAPSTVYSYVNAVESVRAEEGISWDTLKMNIDRFVSKYDEVGSMSWFGAKSNKTVINALKRFAEFVGKP